MKNLPWKKISIGVIGVGVFAVALFYGITSTGSREPQAALNPAFAEYISSYTSGVISSTATIRIILAEDAVSEDVVGSETSARLFSFSPTVKGKTVWLDKRTVEFTPESRLTSGQRYEVNFSLSKLMEVPSSLSNFVYSFQVIPQHYELSIDNIKPYVKTELVRQKIEGILFTSDFADGDVVEKMLQANQDGKPLTVSWSHAGEGKQHAFVIEEVSRKESASKVSISIAGEPLGISQSSAQEVEIPALSDFKVMNVRVDQGTTQHVVVQFSDPLSEKQNLQGLIRIEGLSSLDFEVRDNEVKIYPAVRQTGSKTLTVEAGVRNVLDYRMKEGGTFDVLFEEVKPAVRFVGKGTILPSSDGLILPFEAVNLKAVEVQVVKIYERNIVQFLQVNNYDGNAELRRVGKPVLKKMISLENSGVTDLGKWNRFTLDLATLINTEPGAIYQVRLNVK